MLVLARYLMIGVPVRCGGCARGGLLGVSEPLLDDWCVLRLSGLSGRDGEHILPSWPPQMWPAESGPFSLYRNGEPVLGVSESSGRNTTVSSQSRPVRPLSPWKDWTRRHRVEWSKLGLDVATLGPPTTPERGQSCGAAGRRVDRRPPRKRRRGRAMADPECSSSRASMLGDRRRRCTRFGGERRFC